MKDLYILAQSPAQESGTHITSEPITTTEQLSTKTVARDPNSVPQTLQRKPFGGPEWIFIGLMLLVIYFLLFRAPRKKQQEHKQMVQSLKKNDRVRTIGGIIGTVVDIKGDEITLKVDESNNTKIKVTSNAIGKNLIS